MPGIRLFDVRAALGALAALLLAGMAALAVAIVTHLPALTAAAPAAPPAAQASSAGLSRLQSLPLQAQSVISSTVAASNRSFFARRTASGWGLRSGGGVSADFRTGEPTLRLAGGQTLSLSLVGAPVTSVAAHDNRVTLTRGGGVREWYAAGPFGVEQGFTLAHRPGGTTGSELTLALSVNGSLRARAAGADIDFLGSQGDIAARYGGLSATDATGRHLPSALSVKDGRVVISVNDRGARYPLTIDPLVQQGGKLTGNDLQTNGSGSTFGDAVAISADGNTAVIGGETDNSDIGAAWVFVRTGGVWSQQGHKLVPNNESPSGPNSAFGTSVAISGDGNTALIGADQDNNASGAAWAYTRSGTTWTQGQKITPSDEIGVGNFGHSVAISADGNTAAVGAPGDNNAAGAAFTFVRAGNSWSEQQKLVGSGSTANSANQGTAVAISSNGSLVLSGGPTDGTTQEGAAWLFSRSGSTWGQVGSKLLANDEVSPFDSRFGQSVALSSNGSTALIGGPNDNNTTLGGAAWVFVPPSTGTTWVQQGSKLLPTDGSGPNAQFGDSVALSADGNTALIGADQDANNIGAAWIFNRSGTSWSQSGTKLAGGGETGFGFFGSSAALASDGQTAIIGGPADTSETGAVWAFAPTAPVCNSVGATTAVGGGSVGVTLNCSAPTGASLHYAVTSGPSHGTISGFSAASPQLTYTSTPGFSGQDSFTFMVSDQWGASNVATATFNVPFLAAPTCSNVTTNGKAGQTKLTLTLKCKGPAGHPFTYGIVSKPGNGKLGNINQSNGKVTYTTHIGAQGTDRFVYHATNAGGSSKTATATIKLPQLKRINATMQWNFATTTASFTAISGEFVVNALPGGAKVVLSCTGKKCPISKHTATVPKERVCKGKGKKRKCKMAEPTKGNVNLLKFVAGRHIPIGDHLVVSMVESGWIGKQYNFKMVKGGQPSKSINALAPGSATKLCPLC